MSLTWGQLSSIVKRKAQSTKKNLPILGRVVRADCSDLSVHDLLRDDTCDPLCAKIKEIGLSNGPNEQKRQWLFSRPP